MGETGHRNSNWSQEELEILQENYKFMSAGELQELLPGRTEKAISRKIEKLRAKGERVADKVSPKSKKEMQWRVQENNKQGNWKDRGWRDKW